MQLFSPTLFSIFASYEPKYWKEIEGIELTHVVWGNCCIEKVDTDHNILIVQGRKVAFNYFRDEIFSGLHLPFDLAEKVAKFIIKKQEEERSVLQRHLEEENKRYLEGNKKKRRLKRKG
jgi:hypothetical protein